MNKREMERLSKQIRKAQVLAASMGTDGLELGNGAKIDSLLGTIADEIEIALHKQTCLGCLACDIRMQIALDKQSA